MRGSRAEEDAKEGGSSRQSPTEGASATLIGETGQASCAWESGARAMGISSSCTCQSFKSHPQEEGGKQTLIPRSL